MSSPHSVRKFERTDSIDIGGAKVTVTSFTNVHPVVSDGQRDSLAMNPLSFLLVCLAGWMNRRQQTLNEYLQAEVRVLQEQLSKRSRFTDDQRRRLAVKGRSVGRKGLLRFASIVTPDTLLAWHRRLMAKNCQVTENRGAGRPSTAGHWPAYSSDLPLRWDGSRDGRSEAWRLMPLSVRHRGSCAVDISPGSLCNLRPPGTRVEKQQWEEDCHPFCVHGWCGCGDRFCQPGWGSSAF